MERHSFRIVSGESPKLCGNCAFPQNFHTRKLGEITIFYGSLRCEQVLFRFYSDSIHTRNFQVLVVLVTLYDFCYYFFIISFFKLTSISILLHIFTVIANVQNICNLIGREEYNISHFVLSVSIFYFVTKTANIGFND